MHTLCGPLLIRYPAHIEFLAGSPSCIHAHPRSRPFPPPHPQSAHYMPASKFDLDIRAPTALDPPDVWRPAAFSNCTLPLIFFPHYFSIFADFFL